MVLQCCCKTAVRDNMDAPGFAGGIAHAGRAHGRIRDPFDRFGPRVIDIDLLLFGKEAVHISSEPELVLPHPRRMNVRSC